MLVIEESKINETSKRSILISDMDISYGLSDREKDRKIFVAMTSTN